MFASLTERLSKSVRALTGRGRITEDNVRDTVRQIRMALLEADVALPVAKAFVERVRDRALGDEVTKSLDPGQVFVKIVHDELVAVLGGEAEPIRPRGQPTVVLLAGLQGAGKTTTAGKLAALLGKGKPEEVLLVSLDVYRPAARQQLARLAEQVGARYFEHDSDDPAAIAKAAADEARKRGHRWLIADTAGRLHVDQELMHEIESVHALLDPAETLFVVDAMAGQDALQSAQAFGQSLPLTGVVVTKADGDARGGVALSVRETTGVPIKLIGTGEKLDALEPFDPQRFASRILGMGDVVGLVEQVQAKVDREAAEKVARKLKRGRELNLNDFKMQLEQISSMGGLESLLDKIPGLPSGAQLPAQFDERQIRRQIAIINSMTKRERRQPALIDGSRKRRIAAGAGLPVQDVNRLLKQHKTLVKTMKRASKGGMAGLQGMLSGAMRPPAGGRPRRR
ncbi:MAG: signal recognition particle protein [Gammaproteobacteria bacterium]|nr:signal recognition particle protein [Gammaproteobacteria bacterium]